jgi:DNA repair exonuclease SbcCD ATPase subunit
MNMSELLKKIEAAEKLAADRADQIESVKAEVESVKAQAGELAAKLTEKTAALEAAESAGNAVKAELEKSAKAVESLTAEVATLKAKMALTPVDDLGAGDHKPVGQGAEAAGGGKVDHMKVYRSLRHDPVAQEKYRAEHSAELGC